MYGHLTCPDEFWHVSHGLALFRTLVHPFDFFLNSKIVFVFRKLESSSFHSFAPTTETDIAFRLVRVGPIFMYKIFFYAY